MNAQIRANSASLTLFLTKNYNSAGRRAHDSGPNNYRPARWLDSLLDSIGTGLRSGCSRGQSRETLDGAIFAKHFPLRRALAQVI